MPRRFFPDHFGVPPPNHTLTRPSNNSSPIYSLPNELLEEILYATIPTWKFNDYTENPDGFGKRWLRTTIDLAAVSYRWHELIHARPRMWAIVHGGLNVENIKFLLSKSKNAPLVIGCRRLNESFIRLIEPHIYRWRGFKVLMSKLSPEDTNRLFTETPAPLLESFAILNTNFDDDENEGRVLFAGQAPHLRRLKLSQYPAQWEPKGLSGLAHLQICVSHTTHPGTPSQFFRLLQSSSPLLETLWIVGQRYDISRSHEWESLAVVFPKLKHLSLERPPYELVGFIFTFLQASPDLRLRIRGRKYGSTLSTILPLSIPPENPFFAAISQSRKLRIEHAYFSLSIMGDNPEQGDDNQGTGLVEPSLKRPIHLGFDHGFPSVSRFYELLLSNPACIGQITSLTIAGNVVFTEEGVFNIFLYMKKLVDLHLDDCSNSSLFFAFIAKKQKVEAGDLVWPCINLLHLSMSQVDCHTQDLIACLRSRSESGNETGLGFPPRLKTLTIQRPPFFVPMPEEDIIVLREMADNSDISN
ncbi:hypothetical protein FRC02_010157 [Tulasnella sp. 418]|nr:hypothetical protein FRC02_010157 [Tulasnella sp. 418]